MINIIENIARIEIVTEVKMQITVMDNSPANQSLPAKR